MESQQTQSMPDASARFELLTRLFASFGRANVDEHVAAAYAIGTESLSDNQLAVAVARAIADGGDFVPSVGDLVGLGASAPQVAASNAPRITNSNFAKEPEFLCAQCQDKGYGVFVVNPTWIESHRFEIEAGGFFEGDWQKQARQWCQKNSKAPFVFTVDCNCEAGCRLRSLGEGGKRGDSTRVKRRDAIVYRKEFCWLPPGPPTEWPQAIERHARQLP